MQIPPEKQLMLLWWKDIPDLNLTQIKQLLNLQDINIISKFYVSQKIFPKKTLYSIKELKSLLHFGYFYTPFIPSVSYTPTQVIDGIEYFSLDNILDLIVTNQNKYVWLYRNFLSCFYKYCRPKTKIRCFKCRTSVEKIYYPDTFTPLCKRCYQERFRFKWKYRDISLSQRKYRKFHSKVGYRKTDKNKFNCVIRNMMPLISRRRVNTIKDLSKFWTVDKTKRFIRNKMNFRILIGDYNDIAKVRLEGRPRNKKG